ncbi:MAG: ribosomal-processing cysteine protease Prp [Clostridia bacterium]|nr:ribosomal-processing cysteine protease Prp [Clostridia bacterium]
MISVTFFHDPDGRLLGYRFSGHSDYAEEGSDIVCAAVSSAAYLTANTLTEVLGLSPDLSVEDGHMEVRFPDAVPAAQASLKGLELHVQALSGQYPDDIICNFREV